MEKVLLTSICRPKQWKTISSKDLLESGYPVYGANGKIGFYNSYTHEHSTVLITCRGATCGSINISDPKSYVNGNAMALDNLSEEVDLYYLKYFLEYRKLDDVISGSAQPQITGKGLSKVKIPLPLLDQQKEIAAILDAADAYKQKTKALIAKYDELKQSLFINMFGDPLTNPKGFGIRKLNEFIEVLVDVGSNGGNDWVSSNIKMKNEEDYALMIRTVNLNKQDFKNNLKYVSERTYNLFKKTKVYGGEIIMNKIGSAGKYWIMPNLNRPVSLGLNQLMMTFNNLDKTFFYYYYNTDYGRRLINSKLNGATTKSITKTALRDLDIFYPSDSLQNQFAERVQAIETQKAQAQASLAQAEDLFNSLLQRAFKGELV